MEEENFKIIFDGLKEHMNAKSDADIARGLGISPQALFTFKKQSKFPAELLIKYCLMHHLSIDRLLTGEGEMRREGVDRVGEELAIYNKVKGDPEMEEILSLLLESPQDKGIVIKLLKILKWKKEIKESLEGPEVKNIIKEEG